MPNDDRLHAIDARLHATIERFDAADQRIQERLEALAERHEALSQSLELLHHDIREQRTTVDRLVTAVQQDGENIRALARIAEIHERRLSDLEE